MIVLACAAPVGAIVLSAAGDHILDVRNLASSWPYLSLACSAALAASGPRVAPIAIGLAIVAVGLGGLKMLSARFERSDYQSAADFVARHARPGDVVIDETGVLSPGPLTGLDVTLHRPLPVFRALSPAERDHPFGLLDRIVPLQEAIHSAVVKANGHRVFLVTTAFTTDIAGLRTHVTSAAGRFPSAYRLVVGRPFEGIGSTVVAVYARAGPSFK
jgi:hypothetical protein